MASESNVADVLQHIVGARKNVRLYPAHHPSTRAELEALTDSLKVLFRHSGEIAFHVVAGELFMGDTALSRETLQFKDLVSEFRERSIHTIVFQKGLDENEMYELMNVLNETDEPNCDVAEL